MNALAQDIRYALRSLWKTPGFTAIAMLALALGIGANSAIFTVVNAVLLRPLPFAAPDKICQIYTERFQAFTIMDDRSFQDFEKQNSSFEHVSAISGGATSLTGIGEPIPVHGQSVTAGVLACVGCGRVAGPHFQKQDDPASVAVLSDKLWRTHFGSDRAVLGKVVKLDGAPCHHHRRDAGGIRVSRRSGPLDSSGGQSPAWDVLGLLGDRPPEERVFRSTKRVPRRKRSPSEGNRRNRTRAITRARSLCRNRWWAESVPRSTSCSAPSDSSC